MSKISDKFKHGNLSKRRNTEKPDTATQHSMWMLRLIYLLVIIVFYVLYQVNLNVLTAGKILVYDNVTDYLITFCLGFIPIFLLFMLNSLIVFVISKRFKIGIKFLLDLALSQGAMVCVNLLFIGVSLCMGKRPHVAWMQTIIINLFIFMINEVMWAVYNYRRSKQMYEKSRRLTAQLEYNILRTQVNPHFLFNSLNILYSLVHLNVDKSKEFIMSLSRMYRYIMTKKQSNTVPLTDEMQFVGSYVEVLQTLYYDCFEVEVKGIEPTNSRHIIPYSMQLIIENVIKHNVIDVDNPIKVLVELGEDSLTVSNKLNPKGEDAKVEESTGIGLKYLSELYAMYDRCVVITRDDEYFRITIPLLKEGMNK